MMIGSVEIGETVEMSGGWRYTLRFEIDDWGEIELQSVGVFRDPEAADQAGGRVAAILRQAVGV